VVRNLCAWIKGGAAFVGGIVAYLWGPIDALIIALVACAVTDYITGVLKGICKKELSSEIGFKGLAKKVFMFAIVAVAALIDRVIPAANQAIRSAVIMFYIANEVLSIIENAGEMGLPIPGVIRKVIASMKKACGEDEEDKEE
jgi:toxin secretion/phage lysis holin